MVNLYGIKGGIPKEYLGVDERVHAEEVLQDGYEGFGIGKGLVLVRGVRFLLYNDIRVCIEEILIVKGDATDNAQPVGYETEFVGIAEMSVDVHLLDGGVRNCREIKCTISIRVLCSSMIHLGQLLQYQSCSSSHHLPLSQSGMYLYQQHI